MDLQLASAHGPQAAPPQWPAPIATPPAPPPVPPALPAPPALPPKAKSASAQEELAALVESLQIHKVELEMQAVTIREASAAAETQLKRFQTLFNLHPVPGLVADAHLLVTQANRSAERLLGLRVSRGLQSPLMRLAADDATAIRLRQALETASSEGSALLRDALVRCAGSTRIIADIHVATVGGRQTASRQYLVELVDQTAQIEARVALKSALDRLQAEQAEIVKLSTVARLTGNLVTLCDAQRRIEWVNTAFENRTGWALEELRGQSPGAFLQGPATAPKTIAQMREALNEGRGFEHVELTNYDRQRRPFWIELSVVPVHDEHGQITGWIGVQQDIDARKRAELALRDSEEALRRVFEAGPDGNVLLRPDGCIGQTNTAARRLLALAEDHATVRLVDRVQPAQRLAFDAAFAAVVQGSDVSLELRLDDGAWCDTHLRPLWRAGAVYAVLAVLHDLSDRRRAEAERLEKEAALAVNRLRSTFLSRVSHELRTPLNAIVGFAQIIDEQAADAQQKERIQYILRAGCHLVSLIDDVLDLSRAEAGELRLNLEPLPLDALLAEVFTLIAPQAHERSLRWTLADVPTDAMVLADATRLKQVLLNLLSNAVKYNRDGGWVHLAASATDAGWQIVVSDGGLGLDEAQCAQLFEPFNRLGAEQRRIEGTGIGLVITQRLVAAMRGRLEVHSVAGQGSTFTVTLPGAGVGSSAGAAPGLASQPHGASVPPPADAAAAPQALTGAVLYVEDDPVNALLVAEALSRLPGLRLLVAGSAAEALRVYPQLQPRLVLMDMHLPDGDGLQTLQALRALPSWNAPPVMAITADARAEQVPLAIEAGMKAFMTKPFNLGALVDSVRRLLNDAGAAH